jgi:hypothetical protein
MWQGRTTRGRCWLAIVWTSWRMTRGNGGEWNGDTWPNQWPPRVTLAWFKIYVVGWIRPRDLRAGVKLWEGPPNQRATHMVLNTIPFKNYLNLNSFEMGRGLGRGLAQAPGHMYMCYGTTGARASDRYHMV